MTKVEDTPAQVRWARRRFSIVGSLLAAPPGDGELRTRIEALANQTWQHPTTGESVKFSFKTIERWFYIARAAADPMTALARQVPAHAGTHPSISAALAEAISAQHRDHPRWSYQLHHVNLEALAKQEPKLGVVPGYATICRFMKAKGLVRGKRRRRRAEDRFLPREKRSYEVEHVHGLWHFDFHVGSRSILLPSGQWHKPQLLGILDDRSRLCCHLQWYLHEDTESLVHGFSQAIQKRGVCRAAISDNGAAMLSAEFAQGMDDLSIVHHTTLPETPEQNGKQECFWNHIEGRLLPMLEGVKDLTLELLNEATQAWVEGDYNRREHSEIKQSPLERYLRGPNVGRESPSSDAIRRAFKAKVVRKHRRSDGTVTVEGVRFEVPSAYRTLRELKLRVARWDLSTVDLVDPRTERHLATLLPLDRAKNAERIRRALTELGSAEPAQRTSTGMAPYMRQLLADYAASGMPPGFIPMRRDEDVPAGFEATEES
jgi:transposase InsO family protein